MRRSKKIKKFNKKNKSFNKKSIAPIVAETLLIVVAVLAVIGFNRWFNSYESSTFVNSEQTTKAIFGGISIETVIPPNLYILNKNSFQINLTGIKINNKKCNLTHQLKKGMNIINLSNCLKNISDLTDIVIITKDGIIEKKINILTNVNENSFSKNNTTTNNTQQNYSLFLPYWIEENKTIWTKINISANSNTSIFISLKDNYPGNGDKVFALFDDFTEGEINNTKWQKTASTVTFNSGIVTTYGGSYNLYANASGIFPKLTSETIHLKSIAESGNSRYDCVYHDQSIYSNYGTVWFEGSDDRWTKLWSIKQIPELANLPVTNWNTVIVTCDIIKHKVYFYFNDVLKRSVSVSNCTIDHINLMSCQTNAYDYVFVAKYLSNINVSISKINSSLWKVTINNPNNENLTDFQISIPKPTEINGNISIYKIINK